MGAKRKAQLKTTSRATSSKLLKSKALKVPDLICPCCRQPQKVTKASSPLRIEFLMRLEKDRWTALELGWNKLKVGWSVNAAQQGWLVWACETCLKQGRAVESKPWLQISGYNLPTFAYFDEFRICSDCKKDFVFSASEQAYWYETLEFVVCSKPNQCPDCRKKRREVKQANLEIGEVMGSFEGTIPELLQLADLYEQIGSFQKSLEFLRRAKNKSTDESEIQVLLERIRILEEQIKLKRGRLEV